jgi:sec-independent protein translocase protein TatA
MNYFGLLDFSTPELIIILAIVLLLFGGKKLPELSKSLGSSVREIRKGLTDSGDEKSEKRNEEKTKQESAS